MKADEKKYTCGVCLGVLFEDTIFYKRFACHKCKTHFMREDPIGIKILKEPTEDWKKNNKPLWESVKIILSSSDYIEIFHN